MEDDLNEKTADMTQSIIQVVDGHDSNVVIGALSSVLLLAIEMGAKSKDDAIAIVDEMAAAFRDAISEGEDTARDPIQDPAN